MRVGLNLVVLFFYAIPAMTQVTPPANPDSSSFDPDGTAHITRVVPMPSTVSPEAQQWLKDIERETPQTTNLAERRAQTQRWQKAQSAEARRNFPGKGEAGNIAGVQTDIVKPPNIANGEQQPCLITMLAHFRRTSDSQQLFALNGLSGSIAPQDPNGGHDVEYVGKTNLRDPVLSPLFADLHGFPPSLLVTGTRDALLSSTTIFHRALLQAGVDAQLLVFEAMPHAFWYHFQFPETREALDMMAKFFDEKVGK